MRTLLVGIALLALAATGTPAGAEIGALDVVPAATLLLPYFEVDLADPSGLTTLLSINNASDEAVLAFVTVWSEWWVPIIGFNVYLTGYDVQTISLRDVVVNGDLPNTGPSNALSNLGEFSVGPHSTFGGSCSASLGSAPNYANLSPAFLQLVQQSLSGQPRTSDGLCTAAPGHSTRARGFVTVDAVRACTLEFPDSVGYFVDGGVGTATNQNVLWGDYFLVDGTRDFAQGFTLVHIEADGTSLAQGTDPCAPAGGSPTTFYCNLRNPVAQAGEDNREGLPSVYATRYVRAGYDGGVFPPGGRQQGPGGVSGLPGQVAHADLPAAGAGRPRAGAGVAVEGTDLLVWRGKNGGGAGEPRACDDPPPPLGQVQIVAFDEEENPLLPPPEESPFPFATNRVRVGTDLTVGADVGWLFLNLNGGNPAEAPRRQAFVATVITAEGRFGIGYEAIALNALTRGPGGAAISRDNRRGARNIDPTLGPPPHGDTPTLFGP